MGLESSHMRNQANINIKEIPVEYSPRTKTEGKKISFRDGVKTLKYLMKGI